MGRAYRLTLGEHFTEGARLLWAGLERHGWSQEDLRRRIVGRSGQPLRSGVVTRWLYGVRRPDGDCRTQLFVLLGIPVGAWMAPATRAFEPPAMLEARRATAATRSPKSFRHGHAPGSGR